MKKIRVNLFALTGFGNVALKTLINFDVALLKVYTRKEKDPFPYYQEEQLDLLAEKSGIPIMFVPSKGDWQIKDDADLNLIVTFHRILSSQHMMKAKLNINIHPSLLPSYKGPTPTNWMIHYKEKKCGLTAHFLMGRVDAGDIIYQEEYPLTAKTDSELRHFLADKTGDAVNFIISHYPNYSILKSHFPESYFPSFYKIQ